MVININMVGNMITNTVKHGRSRTPLGIAMASALHRAWFQELHAQQRRLGPARAAWLSDEHSNDHKDEQLIWLVMIVNRSLIVVNTDD